MMCYTYCISHGVLVNASKISFWSRTIVTCKQYYTDTYITCCSASLPNNKVCLISEGWARRSNTLEHWSCQYCLIYCAPTCPYLCCSFLLLKAFLLCKHTFRCWCVIYCTALLDIQLVALEFWFKCLYLNQYNDFCLGFRYLKYIYWFINGGIIKDFKLKK